MAPFLPLLVVAGDRTPGLSILTAAACAMLALGAWAFLRRRSRRAALAALVLGALLVGASFFPRPATEERGFVEGFVTGQARIPVVAEAGTPVWVDEGSVRLEPGGPSILALDCPGRCRFTLGEPPSWKATRGASLHEGEALEVELHGGPLSVERQDFLCTRLPLLLAWMGGGDPCVKCSSVSFLTGAGADGAVRIQAAPSAVC